MVSRRSFLSQLTAASAAISWPITRSALAAPDASWPIAIFEKVFEGLSFAELADAVAEIGADGVEATIRPGGHIEPERAEEEVPRMQEALQAHGKRIVIAATHLTSAADTGAEQLLRTLRAAGVTHYRLGYYRYDHRQPMKQQVSEFAARARDLAALTAEVGIQGLYQTHAGARYLGAMAWDLAYLLDGIDPAHIGAALDLRHVLADSGLSWKTAVAVLRPHMRSIYVKDAVWNGPRSNQLEDVPLDTGFVTDEVFDEVRRGLPPMPLCIHMEHMGYRIFEKHEIPAAIKAHQRDLAALRRWMQS